MIQTDYVYVRFVWFQDLRSSNFDTHGFVKLFKVFCCDFSD